MTEHELNLLNFKKNIITDEESGNGYDYHFYTYHIAKNLTFVSCANDRAELNDFAIENWSVRIEDTVPEIKFTEFGELQSIINLLEKKVRS